MKTNLLKFAVFLLLAVALTATACKKDKNDPLLQDAIEGRWTVESFKVAGTELMGTVVSGATITYEPKANDNKKGDFTQTVRYIEEGPETLEGRYEVIAQDRIRMIFESDTLVLRAEIDDKRLELAGEQDGLPIQLKANQ